MRRRSIFPAVLGVLAASFLIVASTAHPAPAAALAATTQPSGLANGTPIQHVIVVLLENHSFDNVLGPWCVRSGRCNGRDIGTTVQF